MSRFGSNQLQDRFRCEKLLFALTLTTGVSGWLADTCAPLSFQFFQGGGLTGPMFQVAPCYASGLMFWQCFFWRVSSLECG